MAGSRIRPALSSPATTRAMPCACSNRAASTCTTRPMRRSSRCSRCPRCGRCCFVLGRRTGARFAVAGVAALKVCTRARVESWQRARGQARPYAGTRDRFGPGSNPPRAREATGDRDLSGIGRCSVGSCRTRRSCCLQLQNPARLHSAVRAARLGPRGTSRLPLDAMSAPRRKQRRRERSRQRRRPHPEE